MIIDALITHSYGMRKCVFCCSDDTYNNIPTRSNKPIEGLRVVLIFIVLIHHIDILNPNLLQYNPLWSSERKLLDTTTKSTNIWNLSEDVSLSPLGILINVFNGYLSVTMFLILTGYILSFQFFKMYAESISFQKCAYYLITLSIKRSLRFIYPLFVIQSVTYLTYHFEFIKEVNEQYMSMEKFYERYLSFNFLFFHKTNGALWVMHDLFYAPLLVIPAVITIIAMKSFKSRFYVYLLFMIGVFGTNFFPILLGAIMADLLHLDDHKNRSTTIAFYRKYKFAVPVTSFCFLFIKVLFFSNIWFVIDFNASTTFRAIIWFNICLTIFAFPQNTILKILGHRYLSSFGKYTFSLYIVHIPVYRLIGQNIIAKYDLIKLIGFPYNIIVYPLGMMTATIISVIFHEIIDNVSRNNFVKPFMIWFQTKYELPNNDCIEIKTI